VQALKIESDLGLTSDEIHAVHTHSLKLGASMPARARREAPLVDFKNATDFEKWRDSKPREVSVALAARAALRVLPIIQMAVRAGYSRDFAAKIVLPTF